MQIRNASPFEISPLCVPACKWFISACVERRIIIAFPLLSRIIHLEKKEYTIFYSLKFYLTNLHKSPITLEFYLELSKRIVDLER